ncbi:MAG: hypothetical protein AVDCRST_MAG33-2415, partial [uncultured Thermomicrobiales bacterium]
RAWRASGDVGPELRRPAGRRAGVGAAPGRSGEWDLGRRQRPPADAADLRRVAAPGRRPAM